MPTLLATSPFAAMRSAPVTTQSTSPAAMIDAAALSATHGNTLAVVRTGQLGNSKASANALVASHAVLCALLAGAVVLAVLGAAVLLVSGGAWGITSAFALWGAKGLHAGGWFWLAGLLLHALWAD